MEVWLAIKKGRVVEQVLCEDGVPPIFSVKGRGVTVEQAPRVGDLAAELFDLDTKKWVENPDHAAFIVDFDAGEAHIGRVHIEKAIEAKLIKAGLQFDGLLSKEAELLGIPVADLAEKVLAKAKAGEEKELHRMKIKNGL